MSDLQLYDPLDEATESALRHSIRRFGVMQPVVVSRGPWNPGTLLDGHHRSRIAKELGVQCEQRARTVRSEDEAREIARTLNEDRRHLMPPEQRRPIVADLRHDGHSLRSIAGAMGVSEGQVRKDLKPKTEEGVRTSTHPPTAGNEAVPPIDHAADPPSRVVGRDGKSYPSRQQRDPAVVEQEMLSRTAMRCLAQYGEGLLTLNPTNVADVIPPEERILWRQSAAASARWWDDLAKAMERPLRVVEGT